MTLPEKPESVVTHTDDPPKLGLKDPNQKLFKLELSLPGHDIGGQWLCLNTGGAVAYQNYCTTRGSVRQLRSYVYTDGKTYLYDQDGNWLSYETIWNMLYMSYWNYAVAWKIENNRLVRQMDGALLTCRPPRNWPLSAPSYYLSAEAQSEYTLTVKEVVI
jgi:hypothetical protein